MLHSSIPGEMGLSRWFIYNGLLGLDLEHPLALHWYNGQGEAVHEVLRVSGRGSGTGAATSPSRSLPARSRHSSLNK